MSVALICCGVQYPDATIQCTAFTSTPSVTSLTVSSQYKTGAAQAVSAAAIDASTGNWFTKTATGALSWTVTNVPTSSYTYGFILELTNGGLGTQTWPTGTKWPSGTTPTLQSAGTDLLVFLTRDGGTTWRGSLVQGASA